MKRHKIISFIIIVLSCTMFLAGCSDSLDIDIRAISTTLICDVKGTEIWIYVEIANIQHGNQKAGGADNQFYFLKAHGKTIPEARDNLDIQLDFPLYNSAAQAIILTENFANKYLVEYLYRFRADENFRKKGLTIITREDPEDLIKIAKDGKFSLGIHIASIIESLDQSEKSFSRTTMRLLENISADYTGILMPCIGQQNEDLILEGYSVVSGTKVVGMIPYEKSMSTIFLKADNPKFAMVVPYNDINLTIEVELSKRKITPSFTDGKISYDINMEFSAELLYGDQKTPYNFDDTAEREVTEILTARLKKQLAEAIELAQKKFACDYLQFDDIFRVKFPVESEDMDWQKEFINANTHIDVKIDLTTKENMDYGVNDVK